MQTTRHTGGSGLTQPRAVRVRLGMPRTRRGIAGIFTGFIGLALLLLCSMTSLATADDSSNSKTVGNVAIYLGVLPAEMIRGHPLSHPEASMHGQAQGGRRGQYHVVVALFDAKRGTRISNADVTARVSEIGLAGEEKKLESMEIAGAETYGNYFPMAGNGPFRINLTLHVLGEPEEIKATFEHWHR